MKPSDQLADEKLILENLPTASHATIRARLTDFTAEELRHVVTRLLDEQAREHKGRGFRAESGASAPDANEAVLVALRQTPHDGLAFSTILERSGLGRYTVQSTLRRLVRTGRLRKAGRCRFARYGFTEEIALAASLRARGLVSTQSPDQSGPDTTLHETTNETRHEEDIR